MSSGLWSRFRGPEQDLRVEVDPSASGKIIRTAFAIEAAANLSTIAAILYPEKLLSYVVEDRREITSTAGFLLQMSGGLIVCGLTTPLIIGLSNTRQGIEVRRPTYYLLGMGEACLISLMALHAFRNGSGEGISPRTCFMAMSSLLPPLLWRLYTLFLKPQWFGRYRVVVKEE